MTFLSIVKDCTLCAKRLTIVEKDTEWFCATEPKMNRPNDHHLTSNLFSFHMASSQLLELNIANGNLNSYQCLVGVLREQHIFCLFIREAMFIFAFAIQTNTNTYSVSYALTCFEYFHLPLLKYYILITSHRFYTSFFTIRMCFTFL